MKYKCSLSKGRYIRDLYVIPTILYHNGDGIYYTLEIAWLIFFIGIILKKKVEVEE